MGEVQVRSAPTPPSCAAVANVLECTSAHAHLHAEVGISLDVPRLLRYQKLQLVLLLPSGRLQGKK